MRGSDALLYPFTPMNPSELGCLPMIQAAACGLPTLFKPGDGLQELYGKIGESADTDDFPSFVHFMCDYTDGLDHLRLQLQENDLLKKLGRDSARIAEDWVSILADA